MQRLLDVVPFFKVIRFESRHCTSKNKVSPLRKVLEKGFSDLRSKGFINLPPRKLGAIVDCASTAPQVKAKAFSKKLIEKSFSDCGFTNGIDGAPNIHAVMNSSNVPFSSDPYLKSLFFWTACLNAPVNCSRRVPSQKSSMIAWVF